MVGCCGPGKSKGPCDQSEDPLDLQVTMPACQMFVVISGVQHDCLLHVGDTVAFPMVCYNQA